MLSRHALLRAARSAAPLVQTRTYAAAAASDKVIPPVALFGLDGTYATALVRRPHLEISKFFQLNPDLSSPKQ